MEPYSLQNFLTSIMFIIPEFDSLWEDSPSLGHADTYSYEVLEYIDWRRSFLKAELKNPRKLAFLCYKPKILEELVTCISKRNRNVVDSNVQSKSF